MNVKRREIAAPQVAVPTIVETELEPCTCSPLSHLHTPLLTQADNGLLDDERVVPVSAALNHELRTLLAEQCSHFASISILLLHISQLEHFHLSSQSPEVHQRRRYHAPESLLEQVLENVRRAIRADDRIFVYTGVGAVVLFPEVEQQGMFHILERIYANVGLLQAETVVPPLTRETAIIMGIGTLSAPGGSMEQLLYDAGRVARCLNFRPAILTHLWDTVPVRTQKTLPGRAGKQRKYTRAEGAAPYIPFMQLPRLLPARLKRLIPHALALQLHCAPVGRNNHCLTVAMADPTNTQSVCSLKEITGMTIFPVSCELEALDALLAEKW